MLLIEQLTFQFVQGFEANVPNHTTRAAHTGLHLPESSAESDCHSTAATGQPKLPMCSSASYGALQFLFAVDLVQLDQHLDHNQ